MKRKEIRKTGLVRARRGNGKRFSYLLNVSNDYKRGIGLWRPVPRFQQENTLRGYGI
jgi:hypothetical protein